jgi:hypothetical protein
MHCPSASTDTHSYRSTPELELPMPPPRPADVAWTSPFRPRSGPAAIWNHDNKATPCSAASTPCPPHRHLAPSRAAVLDHRCCPGRRPSWRGVDGEKDPASIIGGGASPVRVLRQRRRVEREREDCATTARVWPSGAALAAATRGREAKSAIIETEHIYKV